MQHKTPELSGRDDRAGDSTSGAPVRRELLDRYHLTRLHSEGGLGRVWLATDPSIGREVALKELLAEQAAEPRARARFVREAQITGQLEHPNIVPVYEVGECSEDGRPFYAMRFVRGSTLREAIQEEIEQGNTGRDWPRSRQRLLRALCSVGNAIAHAHSRGIVHRDLKPENIILGSYGELILLDWGLAKHIQDDGGIEEDGGEPLLTKTHAGAVMGTIAYMSPEQADGEGADERTDIYGLGAILYEILTGRTPHAGEDVLVVLREIVQGASPRASSIDPSVPRELDAVCARAMAKDPSDRYAQAKDLVEDLERWLSDEPVSALPDGPVRKAARLVRRHQSWTYSGAGALMLVVIIATISAFRLGNAADRERRLRAQSTAELAALTIGREIDLRWYILQSSAEDDELREALTSSGDDDAGLQTWIGEQFDKHRERTSAESWIVMDLDGIQRARFPYASTSIGGSFAFRDYFHGGGEDIKPAEAEGIEPIDKVHRSVVFRSQVTKNLMVAFSVPVWDSNERERVIGVLGMTVELGGFRFEELELGDTQMLVLVDTRGDGEGKGGQVLQHAELARLRRLQAAGQRMVVPTWHVPDERLLQLKQLCQLSLDRSLAALETGSSDDGSTPDASLLADSFDPSYIDPVGGEYAGRWLAAFEPVLVKARAGEVSATDWVVVLQERPADR